MTKVYQYMMQGTAAEDQTWATEGTITDTRNDIISMFTGIMRASFHQLTSGKAEFGKPGVGCNGPYDITRITIVQQEPK
jgi:hypothetical protein